MLIKDQSIVSNFSEAIQHEWLETNGLGGWASSSVIGCNTRRYHGLLIAATKPPAERMALISKLDETVVINDERTELGTSQYQNSVIHPNGYESIEQFSKELFPQWYYRVKGIELKKTIAMIHGQNTTVVLYEIVKAPQIFRFELLPLLSVRGYHSLMHANDAVNHAFDFSDHTLQLKVYNDTPAIHIHVPGSDFHHHPNWYYHFNYAVEQYRGLDFDEDLFNPGHFSMEVKEGDTIGIVLSAENITEQNAVELLRQEEERRKQLIKDKNNKTIQQLVLAADQFIVKRGEDLKTVIAGYHWFTDWGRDTMISLPGLTLSTGRFDDAKKIISAFAKSVSMGMLPNRFQDNNEPPEYNNVDGTLWYFIAVYKYLKATNDKDFVLNEILPVLKDIIDWHYKGTRFNIHADKDGLLYSGEVGQQLTWMDARIGTWVVTPRMGKPVEIQALWYNALKIFAELLTLNKQKKDAAQLNESAEYAKEQFNKLFWNAAKGYLYDNIDENGNAVDELRPNQLFAISLPFALIDDKKKVKSILSVIEKELYTPVGLRTLPQSDVHYVHQYGGDQWHRDSAYHEGTVWSWLLGAYVDAIMKLQAAGYKLQAKKAIDNFSYHLNEGCIGSVSEIFDADAPHHPRGCVAQAWGVAEVLRVMVDYELYDAGEKKTSVKKKKKMEGA